MLTSSSLQFIQSLNDYELSQLVRSLKFGLVYCRDGQTHENDLLSNSMQFPFIFRRGME